MNDLDHCLEVFYGHANHCVTFPIKFLGNSRENIVRPGLISKLPPYLQGSFIWSTSIPSEINLPVQTFAPTAIQWSVSFNYPSY